MTQPPRIRVSYDKGNLNPNINIVKAIRIVLIWTKWRCPNPNLGRRIAPNPAFPSAVLDPQEWGLTLPLRVPTAYICRSYHHS